MRLVVQEFLTLDGVSQGPGSPDEDTSDGFTRGGWFAPYVDEPFLELVGNWLGEADGLLLGRRTYRNFARDWPQMTDHPFGGIMNALPKYVASHGPTQPVWRPTKILSGDLPTQVAELKQQPGRELQIHGSARLARSVLAAGLVDTLRLVVAPVVLGQGRRLFPDDGPPAGLKLVSHQTTPSGLSVLTFDVTGEPEFATYGPET
ncbi:dihydrofolate reductase family protein [Terrabacter sp. Root181]|uniref:dihydrofolate reductase family protein n=1 Tax=Terrabacter sp. Root181 TaxID=1736484 RepID=UPI0006F1ED91|nr:dihydrofolate reductase family protein [Terrabacter sp. Root181]KRB46133.1 deaminase [Terrabacter sp. Root181]